MARASCFKEIKFPIKILCIQKKWLVVGLDPDLDQVFVRDRIRSICERININNCCGLMYTYQSVRIILCPSPFIVLEMAKKGEKYLEKNRVFFRYRPVFLR